MQYAWCMMHNLRMSILVVGTIYVAIFVVIKFLYDNFRLHLASMCVIIMQL